MLWVYHSQHQSAFSKNQISLRYNYIVYQCGDSRNKGLAHFSPQWESMRFAIK